LPYGKDRILRIGKRKLGHSS